MSRKDLLMKSAEELIKLIEKGAKSIYFYTKSGVPMYDVFISNNGRFVDTRGNPIRKSVEDSDKLLLMINTMIESEIDSSLTQTSLF